ncbi:hypothetical protein [Xanthomonas campestris]|nr:hypothetical protein [Xanthomonas campestris]
MPSTWLRCSTVGAATAPGPRPDDGDAYDAAFVIDPDGHRIQAVVERAA